MKTMCMTEYSSHYWLQLSFRFIQYLVKYIYKVFMPLCELVIHTVQFGPKINSVNKLE